MNGKGKNEAEDGLLAVAIVRTKEYLFIVEFVHNLCSF